MIPDKSDDEKGDELESNDGFKLGKQRIGGGDYMPNEDDMKDIIKFYESQRCSSAQATIFLIIFMVCGTTIVVANSNRRRQIYKRCSSSKNCS